MLEAPGRVVSLVRIVLEFPPDSPRSPKSQHNIAQASLPLEFSVSGSVIDSLKAGRSDQFPRGMPSMIVGNQHKWEALGPERSGVGWRSGELPEGLVVPSPPFDRSGLHFPLRCSISSRLPLRTSEGVTLPRVLR